jgi:hypothetical protein
MVAGDAIADGDVDFARAVLERLEVDLSVALARWGRS